MKALVLTEKEWLDVSKLIAKQYPKSVFLIRSRMKTVLGFTPREHTDWLGYYDNVSKEDKKARRHGYKKSIHLDFYSEQQRTMFLLKYSEVIGREDRER